jgi:hypothetical protein
MPRAEGSKSITLTAPAMRGLRSVARRRGESMSSIVTQWVAEARGPGVDGRVLAALPAAPRWANADEIGKAVPDASPREISASIARLVGKRRARASTQAACWQRTGAR